MDASNPLLSQIAIFGRLLEMNEKGQIEEEEKQLAEAIRISKQEALQFVRQKSFEQKQQAKKQQPVAAAQAVEEEKKNVPAKKA